MGEQDPREESNRHLDRMQEQQDFESEMLETSAEIGDGLLDGNEARVRDLLKAPPSNALDAGSWPLEADVGQPGLLAPQDQFAEYIDSLRTELDASEFLPPEVAESCVERIESLSLAEPGAGLTTLSATAEDLFLALIEAMPAPDAYNATQFDRHRARVEVALESLKRLLEQA